MTTIGQKTAVLHFTEDRAHNLLQSFNLVNLQYLEIKLVKKKKEKKNLSVGFTDCCAWTYLSLHLSSLVSWR